MAGKVDVTFTRPIRRILAMVLFLAVVGAVAGYLSSQIIPVFLTNPELNGLIVFVFLIGVVVAFWQVFRLFSAVNWIEALAVRARGIENIPPPGLLVAMDPLRKSMSLRGLGSSTGRSILDSVSSRLDESRDTLRYLGGLLIFLGLLGTFWGLAKTVPAVVDTIRAIAPQPGEEGVSVFERLMGGLESQLGGMGVAFASSLLGLAGSLVIGFLELMSAGAQNRFYGELETLLSTMTKISLAGDGDGAGDGGFSSDVSEQLSLVSQQMAALNRLLAEGEERRSADSERLANALTSMERIASSGGGGGGGDPQALSDAISSQSRILAAVERLADNSLGGGAEGLDAETRRHIRNIDLLLARMIEETAAGRVETAEALRREMRAVGRAVNDMSSAFGGPSNGGA